VTGGDGDQIVVATADFTYFQQGADTAVDLDGNGSVDLVLAGITATDLVAADFTS
jgi:hypothetical protein